MRIIVTGGAGFIGSALCRFLIDETEHIVLNIDKLTYAGNLESLSSVANEPRYHFAKADICNEKAIETLFEATDFEGEGRVGHLGLRRIAGTLGARG